MEFRLPGFTVEMQHNQVNPAPSAPASSNYPNFSDQAMEEGSVDMRELIQRELEKEVIREKIIAEEVERFHVLEAEVRRELMMGREMMAMKIGMGFPSSFKETITYNHFPQLGTENFCGPTLSESNLKPPPPSPSLPAARVSTELTSRDSKKKIEWRCSICKIVAPCERGLLEHLAGQKHHLKAASIVVKNSPKCFPSLNKKNEWKCPVCEVSASCERALQDHLAGKKQQAKVAALKAENTEKAMKSAETNEPLNSPESVPNDPKEDEKKLSPPPSLPGVAGSMENSKKKMEWRCPICKVCSSSEIDLQKHLAGKKHKASVAIIRKGKNI